jgi:hypothetical protein
MVLGFPPKKIKIKSKSKIKGTHTPVPDLYPAFLLYLSVILCGKRENRALLLLLHWWGPSLAQKGHGTLQ